MCNKKIISLLMLSAESIFGLHSPISINLWQYLGFIIAFVLGVMIWRGVWNLLDKYFIPDNFLLSNLLCIIIPLIVAWILVYDKKPMQKIKCSFKIK
jgi:hypothetical protein